MRMTDKMVLKKVDDNYDLYDYKKTVKVLKQHKIKYDYLVV